MRTSYSYLFALFILSLVLFSCEQAQKVVTPESLGLSSDSLQVAEQKMQEYIDSGKFAGIATLVMKQGHVVQQANLGYADLENQVPLSDSTIFRIFSMTKPVTAVALMILYDEGNFKLDDLVADYLPEFRDTKVYIKEDGAHNEMDQDPEMTIRHLLTHTSGISYGWTESYVDSLYRTSTASAWDGVLGEKIPILAGFPLNFQPGTKWQYGLSIDVAGYLVEVLSGMPLDEFFRTRIFDPLRMDDTGFYVPEEKHGRLSNLYNYDEEGNLQAASGRFGEAFKKPVTLFSGGGGLVSTMDDYLKFCQMLLNGGELHGRRILKQATVDLIMTNQMPVGLTYREGVGYGLAGSVNLVTGEYGWAGAASTKFWINPKEDMIVMTYAQLMPSDYSYADAFKEMIDRAAIVE